jgi:hypothetical protein
LRRNADVRIGFTQELKSETNGTRITRGHINLDSRTDEIFITNALIESVHQDRLGRVYIRVRAYER